MRPTNHRSEPHGADASTREGRLSAALRAATSELPDPPPVLPETFWLAIDAGDSPLARLQRTLSLLTAQVPIVTRERMVLAVMAFVALVFAAIGGALSSNDLLTLMAALPAAAALFTALLAGPSVDPGHAIVSSARTPFAAVVFARTTVALALLVALGLVGSLVVGILGERTFFHLVAVWFGPTVILSALATLLAQVWRPIAAVMTLLAAWGLVITLIGLEIGGAITPRLSLAVLLEPGAMALVVQAGLAAGLTAVAWSLGSRRSLGRARA